MEININYCLGGKLEKWAEKVNQEISKRCENEIDFLELACRPHITLLMGTIDEADFEEVQEIVNHFQPQALNKKIKFTRPYIKEEYVFIDVINQEDFVADCKNLLEKLSKKIVPHRHSIINGNCPHITLGYSKDLSFASDYIKNLAAPPATILKDGIKLSQKGLHGIVLDLQDKN